MSPDIAPVSVVIPILNESATLPALVASLSAQRSKPAELIFVDAGSSDGSIEVVKKWWQHAQWPNARLITVEAPGTFPGAARNAGIEQSVQPWIAFLDAGMTPDSGWLQALMDSASSGQFAGILGMTRFTGRDALTTALCALSYGQDAARPTLPASMFKREIFSRVGKFDPALRAGEDVLWLNRFHQTCPDSVIAPQAIVVYSHFPASLTAAAKKWFVYQQHAARAGLKRKMGLAYAATILAILAGFQAGVDAGLAACLLYLLLRGVADPIRRSARWNWWASYPTSFALAPVSAIVIDIAKLAGQIAGALERGRV